MSPQGRTAAERAAAAGNTRGARWRLLVRVRGGIRPDGSRVPREEALLPSFLARMEREPVLREATMSVLALGDPGELLRFIECYAAQEAT